MSAQVLMPNAALALAELIVLGVLAWVLIRVVRAALRLAGELLTPAERAGPLPPEQAERLGDYVARAVKLVGGLAAFGVVAYNGWLTAGGHDGVDLLVTQVFQNRSLTLRGVAVAAGQIVAILILLKLLAILGARAQVWLVEHLKGARVVRVSDERVDLLGGHFAHLVTAVLWLAGGLLIAGVLNLPDSAVYWISFALSLVVVWTLVRLISDSLDAAVDAVRESLPAAEVEDQRAQRRAQRVVTSIKSALRWAVYVAAGAYVLRTAPLGAEAYGWSSAVVKAAAVIVVAQLALALGTAVIGRLTMARDDTEAERQRRETMLPLVNSILRYVVYFVAGVMALQTLGVNVTAILAGAGIAGLAIGFGAQSLVQDVLSGFFILFEGEYLVGDFVEIGDAEGTVEAVTLRATSLRRRDGALALVPNGEVKQVVNYSKGFVRAVVDVGVSYEGDLERALAVLEQVGTSAGDDIDDITGPPGARVVAFNASDVGLRMSVPVRPGKHWDVACELRRRVKLAFDQQGVEIPFSRHVVILQTPEGEPVRELPVRLVDDRGA